MPFKAYLIIRVKYENTNTKTTYPSRAKIKVYKQMLACRHVVVTFSQLFSFNVFRAYQSQNKAKGSVRFEALLNIELTKLTV
jgi:hypothetical protein